jgi:hypothetical protein
MQAPRVYTYLLDTFQGARCGGERFTKYACLVI